MNLFGQLAAWFSGCSKHGENDSDRNFEILRNDGIRALHMNEFAYAAKCFEAALKIKKEPSLQLELAKLLHGAGQYAEAASLLRDYLEACPDDSNARLIIADSCGKTGLWQEQYDLAKVEIEKGNSPSGAFYLAAEAAQRLGNTSEAIDILDGGLAKDNVTKSTLLLLRVKILAASGECAKALEDANRVESENPDSEDALLLKASILHSLGNDNEAAAYFKKITENDPFNMEAYLPLAMYYAKTNRLDEAEKVCNDAISANADYAEAYALRATLREKAGNSSGATADRQMFEKLNAKSEADKNTTEDGEDYGGFSNIANRWEYRWYKKMNPYGF